MAERNVVIGYFAPTVAGQTNKDFWGPMIKVSLIDPSWSAQTQPGAPKIAASNLDALIDTGAQNSACDTQLAERLGLTKIGTGTAILLGQNTPAQGYKLLVFIPEINKAYAVEGPGRDLRQGGASFDLILGMDFLRFYTLHLSTKSHLVRLQHEE
jgi:hypothetical protein